MTVAESATAARRRDDGRELARVVEVDVHPAHARASPDGQLVAPEPDVGPHRVEDVAQGVACLGGVLWPVRDAHRASGDEGGGEEGGGVGEVRLDGDVEAGELARARPARCWGRRRRRWPPRPGVSRPSSRRAARSGSGLPTWWTTTPVVVPRPGEQQPGDELRGRGGVERHRAPAHPPGRRRRRTAGSRRPPSSTAAPRVRRASRTGPMGRTRAASSPSNSTGPSAECGHRREEAHDGARRDRSRPGSVPGASQGRRSSPRSCPGRRGGPRRSRRRSPSRAGAAPRP